MKISRIILIALLLAGPVVAASNTSGQVQALQSTDYAARLAALDALESQIARASAPKADAAQRVALERELLGYVMSTEFPELSRAYVIRLLPPIASAAAVQPMLQLVSDPKTSRLLGNDAAGLLAMLGDLVPADTMVKSMLAASDSARELLWSAVSLRADPRLAKPLVKQLKNKKIPLDDPAIQTLGAMGGRDAASYLYGQWKKAEGARRTVLARALVHTGAASATELKALCTTSEDPAIRVAALRQWTVKKESAALEFLQLQLDKGASDLNDLIAVQLAMGGRASWDWITSGGTTLPEATLVTVLQSIREQRRQELEPWVLQRLEGASETVELAAIRCLAVVGGSRSTPALVARMSSTSRKVSTEAANALAVLKDPSLDARLQAAIADPQQPDYLTSLDLISRRNIPGSIASFNALFAGRNLSGAELAAVLRGMDRLGNIESVKLLLQRLETETDPAVVRALQISIKRVVLLLEQPEAVWQQAFGPVLSRPAGVELEVRILVVLDAVPTPAALAHCIGRVRGPDAVLARAAEQTLTRWRTIEGCDFWVAVLNDPAKSDADRAQAVSIIDMTLRSESQAEIPNDVAKKAAELFLASADKTLRTKLLAVVGELPNRARTIFYDQVSAHAGSLGEYRAQLENLTKKE